MPSCRLPVGKVVCRRRCLVQAESPWRPGIHALRLAVHRVKSNPLVVILDGRPGDDDVTKNPLRLRVSRNNPSFRCVGDDDANGYSLEYGGEDALVRNPAIRSGAVLAIELLSGTATAAWRLNLGFSNCSENRWLCGLDELTLATQK
jgi:hypothetical protein